MDQGIMEEKVVSGMSLPGEQYRSCSLKIWVQFVVAQPPYFPPKYHLNKDYIKASIGNMAVLQFHSLSQCQGFLYVGVWLAKVTLSERIFLAAQRLLMLENS